MVSLNILLTYQFYSLIGVLVLCALMVYVQPLNTKKISLVNKILTNFYRSYIFVGPLYALSGFFVGPKTGFFLFTIYYLFGGFAKVKLFKYKFVTLGEWESLLWRCVSKPSFKEYDFTLSPNIFTKEPILIKIFKNIEFELRQFRFFWRKQLGVFRSFWTGRNFQFTCRFKFLLILLINKYKGGKKYIHFLHFLLYPPFCLSFNKQELHDWYSLWGYAGRYKGYRADYVSFVYPSIKWKQLIISQLLIVYTFFKTTIVALLLMLLYFMYTAFFFKIQFLKQIAVWFIIGMLYFWLMSGFNFFLKKYGFGKFTSQMQRFWKRTNACFWLIEGFLMALFFYYLLNSSQEPLYMYDYSALNQEYLISLRTASLNIIILAFVIYLMYFVMLKLSDSHFSQLSGFVMLISIFIFFSFFVETYQFYYVISSFTEKVWLFSEEDNVYQLDSDTPLVRTRNQYFMVCMIAKYWHFLFIFLSWVFFLIKSLERRKISYVLFGANLQNMIILFGLNFVCYIQWFKWFYRRFFDLNYTWFMSNTDNKFFPTLVNEMILISKNFITINSDLYLYTTIFYKSLHLWTSDSLAVWKFV